MLAFVGAFVFENVFLFLVKSCGELDYKVVIVGLNLCLVGCFVSNYLSASVAPVDDNIAFFGIGLGADRTKNSTAIICSVAGVYINVQGAEAEWAMVS